jgi:hypothetical protein
MFMLKIKSIQISYTIQFNYLYVDKIKYLIRKVTLKQEAEEIFDLRRQKK